MLIACRRTCSTFLICSLFWFTTAAQHRQHYLGFDRNNYPGDAALPALRADYRYSSYWLNVPPGAQSNTWAGKRVLLSKHDFGFLVLFNGRSEAQLKNHDDASLGREDAQSALASAAHEGFPHSVLIFLDQEEGGRLLPEQSAYIWAWVDAVRKAGARAGVYCSGIDVPDGAGTISTARDLLAQQKTHGKPLALWVANDQCPPSPGCTKAIQTPADGGVNDATVWQYAQSPRRTQFSAGCPRNAAPDGNCYAPGLPRSADSFLDLNVADSPDPSGGRE